MRFSHRSLDTPTPATADRAEEPNATDDLPERPAATGTRVRRSMTRYLLACGAVGPPAFVLYFLIEGATRPGYNPWRHAVSQLSLGDRGWVNSVALITFGLLMLGFARGLQRAFRSGPGSTWGPRLMGIFGLSLVVAGLFPIDPSLGYPEGSEQTYTVPGLVHALNGLILFGALSASAIVLARRFARDPRWQGWAPYSITTAILVAGFFIACTVLYAMDQNGALSPAPGGLLQRLSLVSGCAWITVLAARLTREVTDLPESAHYQQPAKR